MTKKTVALVIIDGLGVGRNKRGNAVKSAHMPFYNSILQKYPNSLLGASGKHVGLKLKQMGNSEVGHLNIGAGRIVCQDMTRIDNAISDHSFFSNAAFLNCFDKIKQNGGNLHILGLMSDGGVHSHISHLNALLQMAKTNKIKNVFIHFFADGRDTDTHSAAGFYKDIEKECKSFGVGKVATISGRFYSMDREQKYQRTLAAYNAIVFGKGKRFENAEQCINYFYNNNISDEFIEPSIVYNDYSYKYLPTQKDGFIFINFRKDRTKQLTESLTNKNFKEFKTDIVFDNFVCMTKYGNFDASVAFEFAPIKNCLSQVISENGLSQAKFSEPTKFAHVTYFLNGGIEEPFKGEDRFKIAAKNVRTFDEAPEMSAIELASKFAEQTCLEKYDFLMCNLANCDMVGHTGNFNATKLALETVDKALKIICDAVLKINGDLIITADHGNAEKMLNLDGTICTTHTSNPVRAIYVGGKNFKKMRDGNLCDLAPTILKLLDINPPIEYTGKSLLV